MASTFSSSISFFSAFTVAVGSLASSREIYFTVWSPAWVGSNGTVFFWGNPTNAIGPVEDVMTPTFTSACAVAAQAALNNNVDTAFLKSMTFSEELQRCKRLMASRLGPDGMRVRPKVRPCFFCVNCSGTQGCYRTQQMPVDHQLSVEGEKGKSRLHARKCSGYGKRP